MKNIFYSVVALSLMLFASCDNENSVNPQTEETGSATISGKLISELEDGGEEVPLNVPITVIVTIDAEDLVLNPVDGVNYGKRYFSTSTTNGEYSITIQNLPLNREITTTVKTEAFRFKYDTDAAEDEVNEIEILAAEKTIGAAFSIYAGGTFIKDGNYTPAP